MNFLQTVLDLSEVWAPLIPLAVFLFYKIKEKTIRIIFWYLVVALFLNGMSTFVLFFDYLIPSSLYINGRANNNIFYNAHTIARVVFFGLYIINVRQYRRPFILKALLAGFLVFVVIHFSFFQSLFFLSTVLTSVESIVLLVMCITYFFRSIHDESEVNWLKHPSFLVCAGLFLYESITFFIFLFMYPLAETQETMEFFLLTMKIYAITYIVFCIFIAMAFYRSRPRLSDTAVKPYE